MTNVNLPVLIIGAGPVGLATAAECVGRKLPFVLLEAGPSVASNIREWAHVRLFSPWGSNISPAARALLEETAGWESPCPLALPLGRDVVEQYLEPLASHPAIRDAIVFNAKVVSVGRLNCDKMKTIGREALPFDVRYIHHNKKNTDAAVRDAAVDADEVGKEEEHSIVACAVIDASGTWPSHNPLLASGVRTRAEAQLSDQIFYGIPDLTNADVQQRFGVTDEAAALKKKFVVVGSGHSALNTLFDLCQKHAGGNEVVWVLRKREVSEAYGKEEKDTLEARGNLGIRIRELVEAGRIKVLTPFLAEGLSRMSKGDSRKISIRGVLNGERLAIDGVDEIIVNTGSRPDHSFLREVRLRLDSVTESVGGIASLIDPNVHSCGSVPLHGFAELQHCGESNFFIVGMKSYGRAPTFLLSTGYEQVRSIVAHLSGDAEGAKTKSSCGLQPSACGGGKH